MAAAAVILWPRRPPEQLIAMQTFFLCVTDTASKLQRICSLTHESFQKKERFLIKVPSEEAAIYIDQLLWRLPEESFTPHAIAQTDTKERVAITTLSININHAQVMLNLCPEPVTIFTGLAVLYELLDLTHSSKEALARAKQEIYQRQGLAIEEM